MKTPSDKNMNEFDWEREIRKDEARINTYLNELNKFLDLPDEENLIMKKLQRNPELIPNNAALSNINFSGFSDDDEEDFISNEELQKKEGADIYMQIQKLAYHWNNVFASEIKPESIPSGMAITCIYGKLLARLADVLDVGQDVLLNLRIALCKRVIADLSELAKHFDKLAEEQPEIKPVLDTHYSQLHIIREKLIDLLSKTREKKK